MADLGNCGSLGNWFASLLLLTAGLLAIIIYRVRRHKVDDYRGHYHVWLWAAACWFLMATDAAASLHHGLQQVMISLADTRIAGDGSIWWVVPVVLLVGCIGLRLLVDMYSSRLSSTALIFAAIAYLTALAGFFHVILLQSDISQLLLVQGAVLGGHLLLATSMGLHARYVILDAEGVLPKRRKAERKKPAKKTADKTDQGTTDDELVGQACNVSQGDKPDRATTGDGTQQDSSDSEDDGNEPDDGESGGTWVAVDPPHGTSQPLLKRVTPSATTGVPALVQRTAVPAAESSSPGAGADGAKLSKADRKALKKKLIEERLKREQRKAANW